MSSLEQVMPIATVTSKTRRIETKFISEFELGVICSRMHDAKHGKALRGDLRISVPIGYIWHREIGLGLDPGLRVQEAVRVVFKRFRQLGSARQVLRSLAAEQMHFPRLSNFRRW